MKTHFYKNEARSVFFLALIFAFRMLGLFMILPIFSMAANELIGASTNLIGIALGAYGLTQSIFQIPLGMLSDRIGRKPVVAIGLILFFIGSVIGACAVSIYGVLLGRAIQGTGAVGSVILALLSDITKIENRTMAMSMIGMSIGFSFMLSIVLGPIIYDFLELQGLFWIMAILALIGLLILQFGIKYSKKIIFRLEATSFSELFKSIITPELMRLNVGILIQHAILTASFMAIPKVLTDTLALPVRQYWMFYVPILLIAFLGSFPLMRISEKKSFVRQALLSAVALLALTQIVLALFHSALVFVTTVLSIFFLAFTLLEAFLPSLISKIAPINAKGSAMGVYSTAQFLGIFLGGSLGGIILMCFGVNAVFLFCGIMAILWFFIALPMKAPACLTTRIYTINALTAGEARVLSQQCLSAKGVSEVVVMPTEGAVLLKIDQNQLDEINLNKIIDLFRKSLQRGNLKEARSAKP